MRAITGAIVSSKPCSLAKAACILERFSDCAASHLPSSDCAAYLRTAAEAASQHNLFRRDLRVRLLQQGAAANLDAQVEGDRKRQDRESKGGTAAPAGGSHRDSAAKAEPEVASGEGKGKKLKKEDLKEDRAVAHSHIPSSPVILNEKRKKGKHPNQESVVDVKLEPGLVVGEELGSEKKKRKKKQDHVKLEEEDANAVGGKIAIVNDGAGEQVVSGGENKRKNHEKAVKEEKTMVADGDLNTDEKRRKKRGRGDHDDNAIEQVEHTKKKQRKQS
ncbi:hypothetical protein U9M48_015876 [Paspalum notatum var. saurae]|uniref:Uncharacterized protein n=1 Tax=Paspalum notatum var. saurae TaxID=547442 RepID=A0AAQ3WLX4_PASNO